MPAVPAGDLNSILRTPSGRKEQTHACCSLTPVSIWQSRAHEVTLSPSLPLSPHLSLTYTHNDNKIKEFYFVCFCFIFSLETGFHYVA